MAQSARTLVLCFDGTGNLYDATNTNVVKFFALLKKDVSDQQLVYYQAGIGTYAAPGIMTSIQQWIVKLIDDVVAWYIDDHVMGGYEFLMQNYRTGDKICLFGFSRGAYTARALAGLLHKVGLLPRDNKEQVGFAYKLYKSTGKDNDALAAGFKEVFCKPVEVEFIGCWDTVSSVGLIWGRHLPFTSSNGSIKRFRHALSLDEHRARFQPNLWHRDAPDSEGAILDPENSSRFPPPSQEHTDRNSTKWNKKRKLFSFLKSRKQDDLPDIPTDVLEVWFAGCHADVGGGYLPSDAKRALSNITLRWMVRQIVEAQCGIQFNEELLEELNIDIDGILTNKGGGSPQSPSSPDEPPKVSDQDKLDAVDPIHDQLVLNPIWWVLEILPMFRFWQDDNGVWHRAFQWNLGRGRTIETTPPKIHMTVKIRMDDKHLNYIPRADWTNKPDAIWVA